MKNYNLVKKDLKRYGFSNIENFFSEAVCERYINKLEKILKTRQKKNHYVGSKNTIVLYNYFLEDLSLKNLFSNIVIDNYMKKIIDDDYVLISAAARNKMKFDDKKKSFASGNKWHTDNRYISKKALKPSINYFAIICLDNFSKINGATKYVPNSHKLSKRRKSSPNYKFLEAKKGSMIIMDSNLMHKAGNPSKLRRWSIFNLYAPWFVKPYFQFYNLIKKKKKLNSRDKKLLHFNSIPPTDFNKRRFTLQKKNNK